MKRVIYCFIINYVSEFEKGNLLNSNLQEILERSNDSSLVNLRDKLRVIKQESYEAFQNLSTLDNDGILYDYLKIMKKYIEVKEEKHYSAAYLSRKTNIQVLTIKRYENFNHLISSRMLFIILKELNLNLIIE